MTKDEHEKFYKLWLDLLIFVDKRCHVFPRSHVFVLDGYDTKPIFHPLRNKLWERPFLFNEYLRWKKDKISEDDKTLLKDWQKRHVKGRFLIVRHTKDYSVLLRSNAESDKDKDKDKDGDMRLYAVTGLQNSIEELAPASRLPMYVSTVIMPYKDRIIYDGMLDVFPIKIERSLASAFIDTSNSLLKSDGIIARL
jgi:hypothetical protein